MAIDWNTLQQTIQMFIPSLLVLAVTGVVVKLLTRQSSVQSEGARFRFQLLTALTVVATLVALIITIPIEGGTRGQLLTLLGLLLTAIVTLSSPTIAANAMAGFMLRSLKNYRPGDFIEVNEYFGRVTEQDLFHTEIQTPDRDLLTLPNLYLATNPVKVSQASGTIISAEVSLGYDIDHQLVEALLLSAAEQANLEEPFVHVLALGDFSVNYRVAGVLKQVKQLLSTRSLLRKKMMDQLHSQGIEIVSPSFMNQRQIRQDIIPQASFVATNSGEQTEPEDTIFDKAEHAQQLNELKESYKELHQELKELDASNEPESEERKTRKLRRLKALKRAISMTEGKKDAI